MAKYSKYIAAFFGSIVTIIVSAIFGFAISKGFGTCSIVDAVEVCRVLGYTQGEVTAWLMGLIMLLIVPQTVYSFPPNTKMVSTVSKPASKKQP